MADALDLDAGEYAGTYKLIGGTPALDFANLVSYRDTDRSHDWLHPAGNATVWARAVSLPVPGTDEVERVREFRELLARVFLAIADGATPAASDITRIGAAAVTAWSSRRLLLDERAGSARWVDDLPSLHGALALDATSLLTSPESLDRIAACAECRWLFLDTSRNRSRRWCDPADCGNRARQRRHYNRHRKA